MTKPELLSVLKEVLFAESDRELSAIIDVNPELLTQTTFDSLMELARQAREDGRDDLDEAIMSAMSKIAPFAVSKNEAERTRTSPHIPSKNVWMYKVRKCLALRRQNLLTEAIAETRDQTEINAFLQAFVNQNLSEVDRLAEDLIPQLNQTNRREEALTVNLLYLDVRAGLAEGQHLRFPLEKQQEMRELGIESCRQAVQVARDLNDKPCEAIYLLRLGGGFRHSRNFPEAEYFYAQALPLYRHLAGQEPDVFNQFAAMTLDSLGTVQSELQNFAGSEKSHLEVVEIYQDLNHREPNAFNPELAMALTNLGTVQRDLRKLADAENNLTEALQIKRDLAIQEPQIFNQSVAVTLINLAAVQLDLQKLADAENSFAEALGIYRNLAIKEPQVFNRSVAMVLSNLGVVQRDLHRLTDAEKSLTEALQIRRLLAFHEPHIFKRDVAMTVNELGNVQVDLRKLPEAERSFTEALQIRRSLALQEPHIFNQSLAITLNNLGLVQYQLFNLADAENSLTESLKIRRDLAAGEPGLFLADVATTLNNLGLVQGSRQEPIKAENSFNEALRIYQSAAEKDPYSSTQGVVKTLNNLGYLKFRQNKTDEARAHYEAAGNLIEDLRIKAITIDDRNRIVQENISVYDNLLACYIRLKNWEKALEIAELSKSRSLSDLLNLKSAELQPKSPDADSLAIVRELGDKYSEAIKELQRLESYEKYLSGEINRFENDIQRIENDDDNDGDTRRNYLRQIIEQTQPLEQEKQKVRDQRFAVRSQLKIVLQEINKFDRNFPPKAKPIETKSIFEISRNLNRTIVIFRLLEESTAVIFIFPGGELHVEEIMDFSERKMFYLFRDNWFVPYQQWKYQDTDIEKWKIAIEQTLEIIYEKLLIGVHRILKEKSAGNEVLFVPNRSLALLPLHAASWKDTAGKKHYLLEEYTISYCPSVSVFKRCLENENPRTNKALFVTNPKEDLYFSEQEVDYLEKLQQPSRKLSGKEATKSAVIKALQEDYGFVHFSCHGFYLPENPFDSGLVMSDEAFKLSEIINRNLQSNWLTTLSACETGMVDFQSPTDEHFGLPLGFVFAGSPSVWASLWSVNDMATSYLMQKAYENLNRKEYQNNKPEALRQSQLEILKHLPHPFFWAGFQHFGL